ncbi:hypothetical protein OC835_008107, partial [Tilletia horrida]
PQRGRHGHAQSRARLGGAIQHRAGPRVCAQQGEPRRRSLPWSSVCISATSSSEAACFHTPLLPM